MTTNLFEDWQRLGRKQLADIDKNSAFPLMRWCSCNPDNLAACAYIDEKFFNLPPKLVISLLSANCKTGFYKYPKKTKLEDNDREELIKEYLCKLYNWSSKEYDRNRIVINEDEIVKLIQQKCGLNKNECKILGVEYGKQIKYKFVEDKPKPAGLDCFM